MDREQAIKIIKDCKEKRFNRTLYTLDEYYEAVDMAIKALEQQPCDKYIKEIDHLRKYIYKLETQIVEQEPDAIHNEREQAYMKGYEDSSKRFRTEPCEDAISREAVKEILAKYHLEESRIAEELNELSSVQRTSNAKKHVENTLKNTLEDAISRQAVKELFQKAEMSGEYSFLGIDDLPPVTVQEKTDDYRQGWHDAIDKALNEAYAIYHYGDIFRVVQEETLIGLGTAYEQVGTEKTGRWIDIQSHWSDLTRFQCTCDQCGDFSNKITPFCPNCGAKMGVEE